MKILNRIKKNQIEGFKSFVENLEVTELTKRQQILMMCTLEDPVYMEWVIINLASFDHFLKLPTVEINKVIQGNEQATRVLAQAIFNLNFSQEKLQEYFPLHHRLLVEEMEVIKSVTPLEEQRSRYFLVKSMRGYQRDSHIIGLEWKLPPQEVFLSQPIREGEVNVYFKNGQLACSGLMQKSARFGKWRHFYDSGRLLAEGEYEANLKNGLWTFYYPSGEVKMTGNFLMDEKNGDWKEFSRDGQVAVINYLDGVKQN